MTKPEVIRSINEIADLMNRFADDRKELLQLAARMDARLHQLRAHATAGRPDLKSVS